MIREARDRYNASFSESGYKAMLDGIDALSGHRLPFRVAETPVFVPADLAARMAEATRDVVGLVNRPDFRALSQRAIPPEFDVPGESDRPLFLALDFGVCRAGDGSLVPQLIELQGFASLFAWEPFLAEEYKRHFDVAPGFSALFGRDETEYRQLMGRCLLGGHDPEHVILLDIEPWNQTTRIDFLLTEKIWGVKPVCITALRQSGREVYYEDGDRRIPVRRIYNRVIYDELKQRDLAVQVDFAAGLDVEWAGHPNWFFRVSKYIMPLLSGPYFPECRLLSDAGHIPDPENYVLKPLFSFSGQGVVFNVTARDLEAVGDPSQYLVQRKVRYEAAVRTPDEAAKAELRLLFVWEPGRPEPVLAANMARLSKGDMVGVKYNRNKSWVGGSVGFYPV